MKKSNSNKNKLVLLYGTKSFEDFVYLPVAAFSKALDKGMLPFPGGHIGFYMESEKFAARLIKFSKGDYVISNAKLIKSFGLFNSLMTGCVTPKTSKISYFKSYTYIKGGGRLRPKFTLLFPRSFFHHIALLYLNI